MNDVLSTYKKKISPGHITAIVLFTALLIVTCALVWNLSKEADDSVENSHAFPVYITEIMVSNTLFPNEYGECCDYIEIYNSADYEINISNFQLTDDSNSKRYTFPSGTIIQPKEYIVVYCQKDSSNSKYASFGLSRSGGETVYFLSSRDVVLDKVVTSETANGTSLSLAASNSWNTDAIPTPGAANDTPNAANISRYTGISPLQITEVMAYNSGYPTSDGIYYDWIELCNNSSVDLDISGYTLSDNTALDKYSFPAGTTIPAGGYFVIYCDRNSSFDNIAGFALSKDGGETIVLKNKNKQICDLLVTSPVQENESIALNDEGIWNTSQLVTPGFANDNAGKDLYLASIGLGEKHVIISEIMHNNKATMTDCLGQFSDWIELHNVSNQAIDLNGWYLSDNSENLSKWQFPAVVIEPNEYLIVYCSGLDQVIDGQIHTNFSLSGNGEMVTLSTPMYVLSDRAVYSPVEADISIIFDSTTGARSSTEFPTPGYENTPEGYEQFCSSSCVAGPIALWEVMVSNDQLLPQADGKCYDWVEIRNVSNITINLSDYSLTDDSDAPGYYIFPDINLNPGQSVVIILSGDIMMTTNRYLHAGFSLNAVEDNLYLYHLDGTAIDYVRLANIPFQSSYGRNDVSGGFYCMSPTPMEDNNEGYRLIGEYSFSK